MNCLPRRLDVRPVDIFCLLVYRSGPAAHTAAVYLARAELKRLLTPPG